MKKLFAYVFLLLTILGANAQIAPHIARTKTAGIDLVAYKTGVKEVVTFRGSLPAGDSFAPKDNIAIPTLVGEMLDQGTEKHDKFAIAAQLDSIGAKITFSVDGVNVNFTGKCLSKDLPVVISLLAEQLRQPAFSAVEFDKVKKQLEGDYTRALESTDFQAKQAFSGTIYPVGHPNYAPPVQEFLAAVKTATIDQLKKFHTDYYGPAYANFVVVGDIDPKALQANVEKSFAGWTGGKARPNFTKAPLADSPQAKNIFLADKPNVTVILGQATGLKYTDSGALALRVGTAILGSGFTGRLMANVRDKEGLTYGIGAAVANDTFADGDWFIRANFAPALLDKGMTSTKRELDSWYKDGVTAAELDRTKSDLVGTFKVGMATTDGMAGAISNAINRGYDLDWLDKYPDLINSLTLDQVNAAIKKHIQPANLTVIKAGTVKTPTGEQ
ncbi:MAG TPA: pitrilysin family protein [Chthoniobacterales bacterium]